MVRVCAGITGIIKPGVVYCQGIQHRYVIGSNCCALLQCYTVGRGSRSRVHRGITGIIKVGGVYQQRIQHRGAKVKGGSALHAGGGSTPLGGDKGHVKNFPSGWSLEGLVQGVGEQLVAVDVHINDSLHPRNKHLSQCCCLPHGGLPRPSRQSWQFGILLIVICQLSP